MEDWYIRRNLFYGNHILSADKRCQRPLLHDSGGKGLDQDKHPAYNSRLPRVLHSGNAAAARSQSKCAQGNSAYGHIRPGSRFCRK